MSGRDSVNYRMCTIQEVLVVIPSADHAKQGSDCRETDPPLPTDPPSLLSLSFLDSRTPTNLSLFDSPPQSPKGLHPHAQTQLHQPWCADFTPYVPLQLSLPMANLTSSSQRLERCKYLDNLWGTLPSRCLESDRNLMLQSQIIWKAKLGGGRRGGQVRIRGLEDITRKIKQIHCVRRNISQWEERFGNP